MASKNKSSFDSNVIEELIKLFFNPKSYFFHTFNKLIQSESQKKSADQDVVILIEKLFHLMSRVNNANNVFNEISQLKGFVDFRSTIENELSNIAFSNLGKGDAKKVISRVAMRTFNFWKERFSNPDLRKYLLTYIKLKESLLNLLDNSSGSDTYFEVADIDGLLNKENPLSLVEIEKSFKNSEQKDNFENHAFRQFLQEELQHILKPVDVDFQDIVTADFTEKYLQNSREAYEKVLELANFHDYPKVQKVCEEILGFMTRIEEPGHIFNEKDHRLIQSARDLIIHSVIDPESNGLHDFIQSLRNGVPAELDDSDVDDVEQGENWQNGQKVEYNTLIAESFQPEEDAEEKETNSEKVDRNFSEDGEQIQFSLPGEDNEELLNLIKDVSLSVNLADVSKAESSVQDDDKAGSGSEIDYESLKEIADREIYQTFAHQAKPFVRIIFESLKLLNEDYNRNAHVIEDIELASSSLKHLARKLNLQKISFFPELVESICINVNAADIKIPTGFLAAIAKGIKHLMSYDPDDESHEGILIDILSDLKRYYAHTVRVIEQTQLASS